MDIIDYRLEALRLAYMNENNTRINNILETASRITDFLINGNIKVPTVKSKTAIEFIEERRVIHPSSGYIPLKLHPYHKECVEMFETNPLSVINHARQMGLTTLAANYAVYFAETNPNSNAMIVTINYTEREQFISKMDFNGIAIKNKLKNVIELTNGSKISFTEPGLYSGECPDLIIIDNAAYVPHAKGHEMWQYMRMTSQKTRMIVQSSSGVAQGFFYDLCNNAGTKDYKDYYKKIIWDADPSKDGDWAKMIIKVLGHDSFAQEYCCVFK